MTSSIFTLLRQGRISVRLSMQKFKATLRALFTKLIQKTALLFFFAQPFLNSNLYAPTTLKELCDYSECVYATTMGLCKKHHTFFTNRVCINDILFQDIPLARGFYVEPCSQCTFPVRQTMAPKSWEEKTLDDLYTYLKHRHENIYGYQLEIHSPSKRHFSLSCQKLSHLDLQGSSKGLQEFMDIDLKACPSLKHVCTNDINMFSIPNFLYSISRLQSLSISSGNLLYIPSQLFHMPYLEDLTLVHNPTLHYAGDKGLGRASFYTQDPWSFFSVHNETPQPMAFFKRGENPWNISDIQSYDVHINIPHTTTTLTQANPAKNNIDGLPHELLDHIGYFLEKSDKCNLRYMNKRFAHIFWTPSITLSIMKEELFERPFLRLYFQKPRSQYFTSTLITENIDISCGQEFDKISLLWIKYRAPLPFLKLGPLYIKNTQKNLPEEVRILCRHTIRHMAIIELQSKAHLLFKYLNIDLKDHLLDSV